MSAAVKAEIAVIGAGSWGTTLAILLARNGHPVQLWAHNAHHAAQMAQERVNARYLPGIRFPESLTLTDDLPVMAATTRNFLVAVPSAAFRSSLQALTPHLTRPVYLAWATKGLEPGTTKLLSAVAAEVMPDIAVGAISGPTFAREVALGLPTALTVAAQQTDTAEHIARWLRNERVRVYTNTDVIGVEIGGAVKNVMAIAAGISDGLGFGSNARAALITRGLAEMTRLGVALGGARDTFMGLTGMGDLILTCTDDQSRNRRVGLALGKGERLADAVARLGQVAEGVSTAREVCLLARELGVDMPITEQVYRVLFESLSAEAAVEALLSREAKPE